LKRSKKDKQKSRRYETQPNSAGSTTQMETKVQLIAFVARRRIWVFGRVSSIGLSFDLSCYFFRSEVCAGAKAAQPAARQRYFDWFWT